MSLAGFRSQGVFREVSFRQVSFREVSFREVSWSGAPVALRREIGINRNDRS
jgi:hypothetical protein